MKAFNLNFSDGLTNREENPRDTAPLTGRDARHYAKYLIDNLLISVIVSVFEIVVNFAIFGECLKGHVGSIFRYIKFLNKQFKSSSQFMNVLFYDTFVF